MLNKLGNDINFIERGVNSSFVRNKPWNGSNVPGQENGELAFIEAFSSECPECQVEGNAISEALVGKEEEEWGQRRSVPFTEKCAPHVVPCLREEQMLNAVLGQYDSRDTLHLFNGHNL